jgi:hypothetical protein
MRADRDPAKRERRGRLHDRSNELDVVVELAALAGREVAERLDGDVEPRPERRWFQTPPTTPSIRTTGKLPAWPPASARIAATPGYSRSRG